MNEPTRREVMKWMGLSAAGAAFGRVRPIGAALSGSLMDESGEATAAHSRALAHWRSLKFGLIMHWGIYAQWGAVESWPIEAAEGYGRADLRQWEACGRDIDRFRAEYRALSRSFNPSAFDPGAWADAAHDAGMKYAIFTTKHHDGFCMFDTRQTEFRITHPTCPFHANPKANVTRHVFDAMRGRGLKVGAYFSKPDWNHPDFWDRSLPAPDKFPNYDVSAHPERWAKFRKFVHEQIDELMTGYGPVDILWLDGSWVAAPKYDVQMHTIAAKARATQKDLIVVDRWVPGPFEDYLTPEQKVPPEPLAQPWESCITMGDQWSWKPSERYKSVRTLIHMLVDVVAKGGNLLLNVGPDGEGRMDVAALERLRAIGSWLRVNGRAIYDTQPVAPWKQGNVCFTRGSDGTIYAIVLAAENETTPPRSIEVPFTPKAGSTIRLLGDDRPLEQAPAGSATRINLPTGAKGEDAWALAMSVA